MPSTIRSEQLSTAATRPWRWAAAAALAVSALPMSARSQEIPRADYFRYVPLEIPLAYRETPASRKLQLFGDRESAPYTDADLDGIDDRRAEVLRRLALRFAPLLVRNSTAVPLDAL